MASRVANEYSEYPCVYKVSQNGDTIRIDMIHSNYSVYGGKLTVNFKPASMYNSYQGIKGHSSDIQ